MPGAPDPKALSERERQVVHYVLLGHSTKETAYALGLSAATIAGHLASAMRKLGVKNRVELLTLLRGAATPDVRPKRMTIDGTGEGAESRDDEDA